MGDLLDLKEGHHGTFRPRYTQYEEHKGKGFVVVRQLTDAERDREVGTMYKIKLDTGEQIDAWPEELEVDCDDEDCPIPRDMKRCEYCGGIAYKDVVDRRECCPKNKG